MTARHHHYVPQLYLKGFVGPSDGKQLFVVDGVRKTTFETVPRNVAGQRDFNRVELEGIAPDALEAAFSGFETEVAASIARVCERASFTDHDDRANILNLIGLITLRNPRQRDNLNDFQRRIARAVMEIALETPERWEGQVAQAKAAGYMPADAETNYESMKAFIEGGEYTVELKREAHIALELSTFEKVLPHLFQRKWTLVKANEDAGGFITSDHPVCLKWAKAELQRGPYGPGLGLAETELLFPLTSDFALVGSFEGLDTTTSADIVTVAQFNAVVMGFAERQLYAASPDFPYLGSGAMPFCRGAECLTDGTFIRPRKSDRAAA